MAALYDQLKRVLPENAALRGYVREVEQLPGFSDWKAPDPIGLMWPTVAGWGHVLELTKNLPGTGEIRGQLAQQILLSGKPSAETFAELSVAALCVALGCIAAGRIPLDKSRTADWRMIWPVEIEVDVEVTAAMSKKAHRERQEAARVLAGMIFDADRSFDLILSVLDPTEDESVLAIRDAARNIAEGEEREASGRWTMRAVRIDRRPTELLTSGNWDSRPTWWPSDCARSFVFHQHVAALDASTAPPQVRIWVGLPYDAYLNPVQRKANAPQGSEGVPFLVAADIHGLPGAFREIPRAGEGFLPFWPAVSGILLFQDSWSMQGVGWLWRLVSNPHARMALPTNLIDKQIDSEGTLETIAKFE